MTGLIDSARLSFLTFPTKKTGKPFPFSHSLIIYIDIYKLPRAEQYSNFLKQIYLKMVEQVQRTSTCSS